ncbi:FecCD family ABC transporter permease [Paenibacillus sp. WLX1005]|uniref:FecCD family ABC transporter permease n=1 Tax=Paenibacillus sp. WLX1005 TaxID=3243766 RepID=UPI0039845A60
MKRNVMVLTMLSLLVLLLSLLSIKVGAVSIGWLDILQALTGRSDSDQRYIVLHYRLPRIVVAILVGSGLAVSGLITQALLRNPLAAPDTLGISAGASLGAVLTVLILPPGQPVWVTPLAALIGGFVGGMLVYGLSYSGGIDPVRLALVGIAVSACGSTLVQLLVTRFAANASTVLLWLNGSLWGRTWDQVIQSLPIIGLALPVTWVLARRLDILALGDETSRGLGLRLEPVRLLLFGFAIALAGGSVAAAGMIGFAGLVSPHMARRLVSRGHRILIPVTALVGAALVLLADMIGRILAPPVEFPAGLVTAVIGAPYFLYLLWREFRPARART